jgi:beta-carotene 15,15'-dioxygenase
MRIGVVSFWVILLTLCLSIYLRLFSLPASIDLYVFVFLMLLFGIPHGAADHIVYFNQTPQPTSALIWVYFFRFYLGIMLAYALAWWLFPLLCFVGFLIFSAYHFGQSQLYYLPIPENSWIKVLLYSFWGSLVLLSIIGFNASQTSQILSETPFQNGMQWVLTFFTSVFFVNLFLFLFCFVWVYIRYKISFKVIFQELCLLFLLLFLSWSTSILWSFSIYFALWHSLQTIEQEIKVFRLKFNKMYTWKNYLQDALPFTLISVFGIAIILSLVFFYKPSQSYVLFGFFVIISILTAPHAWLIGRIYEK